MNYYRVLGVSEDATVEEIKRSFKEKAKIYHPDKNNGTTTEQFKVISEAYHTLIDEDKRRDYDTTLHGEVNVDMLLSIVTLAGSVYIYYYSHSLMIAIQSGFTFISPLETIGVKWFTQALTVAPYMIEPVVSSDSSYKLLFAILLTSASYYQTATLLGVEGGPGDLLKIAGMTVAYLSAENLFEKAKRKIDGMDVKHKGIVTQIVKGFIFYPLMWFRTYLFLPRRPLIGGIGHVLNNLLTGMMTYHLTDLNFPYFSSKFILSSAFKLYQWIEKKCFLIR